MVVPLLPTLSDGNTQGLRLASVNCSRSSVPINAQLALSGKGPVGTSPPSFIVLVNPLSTFNLS